MESGKGLLLDIVIDLMIVFHTNKCGILLLLLVAAVFMDVLARFFSLQCVFLHEGSSLN